MADDMGKLITMIIALTIGAILIGSVFVVGLGTLANGTAGTACVNCSATTIVLLDNLEIFLVIGLLLVIIGIAIAAFRGRSGN